MRLCVGMLPLFRVSLRSSLRFNIQSLGLRVRGLDGV